MGIALKLIEPDRAGRRGTMGGALVAGGLCCILYGAIPQEMSALLVTLALLGKAPIAAAFGVAYLFSAELFPTSVRSRSLSLMSLCGRVAGMIAPVVADLGSVSSALPFMVFGAPCLFSGVLLFTVCETAGQPMLNTIDDIVSRKGRPWICG